MSVTLVPSNLGFGWGTPTPETGINVNTWKMTVKPEVNEVLAGPDGQGICRAIGDPMADLEIAGEHKANTGVFAATFVTAFVPANAVTAFGRAAGGFYLQEGEISFDRGKWNEGSAKFESRPNIA